MEIKELKRLNILNQNEKFDAFKALEKIINRHSGKLMIIPILYDCDEDLNFQFQAARLTGGSVICTETAKATDFACCLADLINGISVGAVPNSEIIQVSDEMINDMNKFEFLNIGK